jgi:hypothetical protein
MTYKLSRKLSGGKFYRWERNIDIEAINRGLEPVYSFAAIAREWGGKVGYSLEDDEFWVEFKDEQTMSLFILKWS